MLYYVRLWIVLVMDISVYMLVSVFSEDISVMSEQCSYQAKEGDVYLVEQLWEYTTPSNTYIGDYYLQVHFLDYYNFMGIQSCYFY